MRATVQLQEIAQVIRGVSFDKEEVLDEGRDGYRPILRAGNIDTDLLIDRDLVWVPESRIADEQRMRAGDIAICMSSGSQSVVGKTAALRSDWTGSVGAFCAIVRPQPDRVLPDWLSFFLQSEVFRTWTRQSTGANIKIIRKSELEAFPVPLPSLDEQRRIVDLLARAEGIVRLRREAQKKAAAIIPALFLDMFGDPATNPKGYKSSSLGAIAKIVGGSSLPAGKPFAGQQNGLLLLKVGDMNLPGNEVLLNTSKEWVPNEQRTYSVLGSQAIVFPKRGAAIATNKKRLTTRPSLLDPNLMGIEPDIAKARPVFLYHWFCQFDLATITNGSTVPQLNKGDLAPLDVYLPAVKDQLAFEEKVQALAALTDQQATALAKSEAVFRSLLSRAFISNAVTAEASPKEAAVA